jgi:hypothetical protein
MPEESATDVAALRSLRRVDRDSRDARFVARDDRTERLRERNLLVVREFDLANDDDTALLEQLTNVLRDRAAQQGSARPL